MTDENSPASQLERNDLGGSASQLAGEPCHCRLIADERGGWRVLWRDCPEHGTTLADLDDCAGEGEVW